MVYNPDEPDPVIRAIQAITTLIFFGGIVVLLGFCAYWAIFGY